MSDKNRLLKTFFDLIKIDSPSGDEKAVGKYIINKLISMHLSALVDRSGNIFVSIPGTGEPVVLNAHLDTVEPGRGIKPQIVSDIVKSDGTTILGADNKAALAVFLDTVQILSEQNISHRPLEIVLSVREETDGGIKQFDFSSLHGKEGYCFDGFGEIGNIILAAPFITEFSIEVIGKAAHAGIEPEKGINALNIASQAISSLTWGRIDTESTANIGLIHGGEAVNTVPRSVHIKGDVRSISSDKKDNILKNINMTFSNLCRKNKAQLDFSEVTYCEGYRFSGRDALVQKAHKAMLELGISANNVVENGGADANEFNSKGIRMLNFGYGARDIHTVNEEINVRDISLLEAVLMKLITE